MRILKILVVFFSIIVVKNASAQSEYALRELNQINNLIEKFHLDSALTKLDSLNDFISINDFGTNSHYIRLKTNLYYAKIYERKEEHQKSINLLISIIEDNHINDNPELLFNAYLTIALVHEKIEDFSTCRLYLDKAIETNRKYRLDVHYSTYCVRRSSYNRFVGNQDSAIFYANEAVKFAKIHKNENELLDGYLLLGILLSDDNLEEAVNYTLLAKEKAMELNNFNTAAIMLYNISRFYYIHSDYEMSKYYIDSTFRFMYEHNVKPISYTYRNLSQIFANLNQFDSAYYYYTIFFEKYTDEKKDEEVAEIKRIVEQYENDKKEAVIRTQNLGLYISIVLVLAITIISLILYRKNTKIRNQNSLINHQIEQLQKFLDQKEVLLSELQHRVKNNLQQVISLLEIQKESLDYNDVEEIIRQNQNRIQSMALLHNKLSYTETNAKIDFQNYLDDLVVLVYHSYSMDGRDIEIETYSDFHDISIDDAVPLGLILVELVSNSMKHAFQGKNKGKIQIHARQFNSKRIIEYKDDGIGIKKNVNSRGLGLEIINGLVDQINAKIEIDDKAEGFSANIYI